MQLFTREVFEAKKIWMHVGLISLNDEAIFNMNCESPSHGPPDLISLLFKQCSFQANESWGEVWLWGRRKFPTAAPILRIKGKDLLSWLTQGWTEFFCMQLSGWWIATDLWRGKRQRSIIIIDSGRNYFWFLSLSCPIKAWNGGEMSPINWWTGELSFICMIYLHQCPVPG